MKLLALIFIFFPTKIFDYCVFDKNNLRICSYLDSIEELITQPPKKQDRDKNEKYFNFSPKLNLWYEEAYSELNLSNDISKSFDYAIYPKRFYENVSNLLNENSKTFDFCFIGGLKTDHRTFENRKWILKFIRAKFGNHSYLQFTDDKVKENYLLMGGYDYTLAKTGFVPKYVPIRERNFYDLNYFETMSRCRFCLTPAGDNMFSMRFYESLMTKCIPIVSVHQETYRSKAESELPYFYYLSSETTTYFYRDNWVEDNYELFLKFHTLKYYQRE